MLIFTFRQYGKGMNEVVATFLGMYEIGPLIVLKDKQVPAKYYWNQMRDKQQNNSSHERTFVKTLVTQVCHGLKFLHQAHLVSPVLSLSTVLVNTVSLSC